MKEALNMALEVLERYSGVDQRACDAEDALRTAIEAAEKMEPRCAVIVEVFGKDWRLDYMSLPVGKHKLYTQNYVYTTPPAAQPAQEPVQVSVEEFVHIVEDKEHLVGRPIVWAQWPSKEKNGG